MSSTREPWNLMVSTPAYGGMVHTDFVHALLGFTRAGLRFALQTVGNESLISRARNTLLANFHAHEEFTHLLFLDGDVYIDPDGVRRMLTHDVDVVGAPVRLKSHPETDGVHWNTDARTGQDAGLQEATRIGTAVFMLNRRAVDALVQRAREENAVYDIEERFVTAGLPRTHYDVFRTGVVDGIYLSEDFWVCNELRKLGFTVCVDASVFTRHHGNVAFE